MALQLKNNGNKIGRNEPCPCGSGLKFKYCHNDPVKKAICEVMVREEMLRLIMQEKYKCNMITEQELREFLERENNGTS